MSGCLHVSHAALGLELPDAWLTPPRRGAPALLFTRERGGPDAFYRGERFYLDWRTAEEAFDLARGLGTLVDEAVLEIAARRLSRSVDALAPHRAALRFLTTHAIARLVRPFLEAEACRRASGCERVSVPRLPALVRHLGPLVEPQHHFDAPAIQAALAPLLSRGRDAPNPHAPAPRAPERPEACEAPARPDCVLSPSRNFVVDAIAGIPVEPLPTLPSVRLSRFAGPPFTAAVHRRLARTALPAGLIAPLAGRLAHMIRARFAPLLRLAEDAPAYPDARTLGYWDGQNVEALVHASVMRARGHKVVELRPILCTASARCRTGVYDGCFTVGTGQSLRGEPALGPLSVPALRPNPDGGRPRTALLVLQPRHDLMVRLAGAQKVLAAAGLEVAARVHPKTRRDCEAVWRELTGGVGAVAGEAFKEADLVVAGTSNFAIDTALSGGAVLLVADAQEVASLWPGTPPPGAVWDVTRPFSSVASLTAAALAASQRFREHLLALPRLTEVARGADHVPRRIDPTPPANDADHMRRSS